MSEYVKVVWNDIKPGFYDGSYEQDEEIIKTKDLIKIVKLFGKKGTGIRFEWYCENRKSYMKWDFETLNTSVRDRIFKHYEELLTGTYIDTTIDYMELKKLKIGEGEEE